MILVDSAEAIADWRGINEHVKKIFDRSEAEIVSMRKWDERPLAYEIMDKKRGTYILVYFNCISERISAIERDFQLSERIFRTLILRGDHITKEDMEKDTPAILTEKGIQQQAASKEPAGGVEEIPVNIETELGRQDAEV
jgi:ribosomal protein S6